jgi:hypothetical protein
MPSSTRREVDDSYLAVPHWRREQIASGSNRDRHAIPTVEPAEAIQESLRLLTIPGQQPDRVAGLSGYRRDRKPQPNERAAREEGGGPRSFTSARLHISSAILNTSQPSAAKLTPQKSMAEAMATSQPSGTSGRATLSAFPFCS